MKNRTMLFVLLLLTGAMLCGCQTTETVEEPEAVEEEVIEEELPEEEPAKGQRQICL